MKNKIMILIGFLIICMTLGLIGNTGYVQVKKDDTAKKENEQSNELKSSTYSGISVGDKWTMGNKDPNDGIDTQNISYEITSISGDSLLADIYVDGILIYSSGHIEGAVLTDDWISTHINLPWTITYSDTYGGRTLTVCDTQESFGAWKIFDISTGIVVETDFDILTSWDIYEAPPPPLPPYSGVSVGDTWTYEYFFGNVSFEITSVSFPSVWANEYWDGVYERETDVAIAYVLEHDEITSLASNPDSTIYTDTYGGRTLTVCNFDDLFIFDTSTGIKLWQMGFDGFLLISWDIYVPPQLPPPPPPDDQNDFGLGRDASNTAPGDIIGFGKYDSNTLLYSSETDIYEDDFVKFWLESDHTISIEVYTSSQSETDDLVVSLYDPMGTYLMQIDDGTDPIWPMNSHWNLLGPAGYFTLKFEGELNSGDPDDIIYTVKIWVSDGQDDFDTDGDSEDASYTNPVSNGTYVNCLSGHFDISDNYHRDVDRADVSLVYGDTLTVTVSPYPSDNPKLKLEVRLEGAGLFEHEKAGYGETVVISGTATYTGIVNITINADAPPDNYYEIEILRVESPRCATRKGTGIMLAIDASGSVNIDEAVASAELIIESVSPYAHVGLVIFKADDELKHELAQPAKNNYKDRLISLFSEIDNSGMTNIYAGLTTSLDKLREHCFKNQRIIILTDGTATMSDNGMGQFEYCDTSLYDSETYKQHWISDEFSPLVIAHEQGVNISAISIGGAYNPHFFDAVQTASPYNDVSNANDIWELVDKLQDVQRATEDWDNWTGWKGNINSGECVEITAATNGLDVTAKQGYVLSLHLWWLDANNYGTLRVTDQNDEPISFIPPTSDVGDRPFSAYFYIDSNITSINIYACINYDMNSNNHLKTANGAPIQYDLDLDTKPLADFNEWNSDPFAEPDDDDDDDDDDDKKDAVKKETQLEELLKRITSYRVRVFGYEIPVFLPVAAVSVFAIAMIIRKKRKY